MTTIGVCPACGYPVYGAIICFACQPSVAVSNQPTEPHVPSRAPREMRVGILNPGWESAAQAG